MISPGYPAPARPPVVRPLWSLAGPALGALLAAGQLTAPMGPLAIAIQRSLGLSIATIAVTVVAPYVVATAALITPGYLLGRQWPTATSVPALALLMIGSLVSPFASGLMAIGQVVGGLGAGTVVGVALALSGQVGRRRSQARLALGLALGAALLIGPIASGMVTRATSWRIAFMANVPVAVVALVVTVAGGIAMLVLSGSRSNPPVAPATTMPFPSETRPAGPAR